MEQINTINTDSIDLNNFLGWLDINEIMSEMPAENWCQLRVSLTQLCNEACFFCHNEWNSRQKVEFNDELFKKAIDIMVKHGIKQRIRFTWWEPLLYDWIFELIKYIKDESPEMQVWLTTNALLLEEKAGNLVDAWLDKITISIHSLTTEWYKEITKVDWLAKVLRWLEKLKELGFKWEVCLNSVIWKHNVEEVYDLEVFCETNWYKLKLLDILPVNSELEELVLTQRQIEEISNITKAKWIRTQKKCFSCPKKTICWWEAEYLRMSPDWVFNPCLSLKNFDIDFNWIEWESNLEKWFLLWLRRVVDLSL